MKKITIAFILFSLALAIFSFQSDVVGLEFKGDEGFYFQSSRQMIEKGDWVTPYYFDRPRFEKPILFYWLVAVGFKFFGVNWRAARLASAVSMALVAALSCLFGMRLFNKKTGIFTSLFIISTITTFRYARLALPESFFTLLLCASLYILIFKKGYIWAYILMGLAVLTKGPVGLILPLFITAAYRYSIGERAFFKNIKFTKGLFITLLVSLPWFLLMIKAHGRPYIEHIFFRETIQRIGGAGDSFRTLLYFVPVIFIFYLPWSLFIVPSIKEAFLAISEKAAHRDGAVFSFVWFFAILIFFTFLGEKHSQYMLYACVPLGLMAGNYFHTCLNSPKRLKTLFIFIPFFLSFFIFESEKLAISREIGGLGAMLLGKSYNIEKEDYVGIGSHSILPQEVEIYINHPTEQVCFKWPSQEEADYETANILNKEFFNRPGSSYLIIKKNDYLKLMEPKIRKTLTILGKGYMYSKGAGPGRIIKAVKRLDRKAFLNLFREEVYFVTNKKEI